METYQVNVEFIVHAEDHQSAVDMVVNSGLPQTTGADHGIESWNPFQAAKIGVASWHHIDVRYVEDHVVTDMETRKEVSNGRQRPEDIGVS